MNLRQDPASRCVRLYTSSWRYLYGVKAGAIRVDLDGNPCGELTKHVEHARKQLKKRKLAFRRSVLNSKRKNAKLPQLLVRKKTAFDASVNRVLTTPRRKEGAERKPRAQKPVEKAPKTVKAPRRMSYLGI